MNNKFSTKLLFIVLLFLINIVILQSISNKNKVTAIYTGCSSDHYEGERNRYKVTCGGEGTCTNVVCTIPSTRSWYNTCEYTCNESGNWDCEEIADLQCKDGACDANCEGIPTNTPNPTPRPTRTPTPRPPTRTPTPTITTVPTITPTPTIDPTICECNGMEYSGSFSPGAEVVFTAKAKVDVTLYPDAKVTNITFHVERWDGTTRSEIAVSDPVPARGPVRRLNEDGTPYDEYSADWNYRIPETDTGEIEYTVRVESACGSITAFVNKTESVVLSVAIVRKLTFAEKITGFFKTLISVLKNSSPIAHLLPQKSKTNVLGITPGPTIPMTLKLQAFNPADILPGSCSEQKFRIRYE